MEMPRIAIVYGALLVLLGIAGYTHSHAPTALIPAALGVIFVVLGIVSKTERNRKHAMHAAAVLALLGFLASVGALRHLPALLTGAEVARPAAVISRSALATTSIIFLIFCIRSFRAARLARNNNQR